MAANVGGLLLGIAGVVAGLLVARWEDARRHRMLQLAGSQGSKATIIVEVRRANGEIKRYPVNPEEEEGIRNLLRAAEDAEGPTARRGRWRAFLTSAFPMRSAQPAGTSSTSDSISAGAIGAGGGTIFTESSTHHQRPSLVR